MQPDENGNAAFPSLHFPERPCEASIEICSPLQAVIGAGAAGLVTARELRREGHEPVIFEQGSKVGGVWVYTDKVEEPHGASGWHQLACPLCKSLNAYTTQKNKWISLD